MQTDYQTDRRMGMTKLICAIYDYAKAPNKPTNNIRERNVVLFNVTVKVTMVGTLL
jgi:hypothetical protein